MNAKYQGNHLRAVIFLALIAAAPPAWGQRIRFSQPPAEEKLDPEPEPAARVASQAPLKPKALAADEILPSPPPVKPKSASPPKTSAAETSDAAVKEIAPTPLARRIPEGEPVETPPPYFVEPDPNLPLYDYEPHGAEYPPYGMDDGYGMDYGMECGPACGPWRPTFSIPGLRCVCSLPDVSWLNGVGVFGEALYLRPRDTEVALAVPSQNPVVVGGPPVPVPQGSAVILDPDYEPGYRAGIFLPVDCNTSFRLAYTMFESRTSNAREATADELAANINIFPLLMFGPTLTPVAATNVSASGQLDVNLKMLDADTRLLLWDNGRLSLTGYAGARWAELEQQLIANYSVNGGTVVQAMSSFEGIGPRMGIDGYGSVGCWGFGYYARSEISFLYGAVKGDYRQFQVNNPDNPQIFTNWKAGRIAPVYEMEMGLQWMGPRKRLRVSLGYLMSVWFNVLKTEGVVQGVQENHFDDLSDSMTFDGVTARVEFRL